MPKTIGQDADDAAFQEMLAEVQRVYAPLGYQAVRARQALRLMFDRAIERGLEKRGCCQDKEADDGGR